MDLVVDFLMIVLPPAAYIPQYLSIRKSGDARGFSTLTSAILIISGILRVYFWFGKQFAISLLAQAILMIVCQLVLLELCIRVTYRSGWKKFKLSNYTSVNKFWKWQHFGDYVTFLILLIVVLTFCQISMGMHPIWVESVGFASLFIESLLGVPQAIENYKKRSTVGLSSFLILSWLIGDMMKTLFHVMKDSPPQFIGCGVAQIIVDIIIILQIKFYDNKTQML